MSINEGSHSFRHAMSEERQDGGSTRVESRVTPLSLSQYTESIIATLATNHPDFKGKTEAKELTRNQRRDLFLLSHIIRLRVYVHALETDPMFRADPAQHATGDECRTIAATKIAEMTGMIRDATILKQAENVAQNQNLPILEGIQKVGFEGKMQLLNGAVGEINYAIKEKKWNLSIQMPSFADRQASLAGKIAAVAGAGVLAVAGAVGYRMHNTSEHKMDARARRGDVLKEKSKLISERINSINTVMSELRTAATTYRSNKREGIKAMIEVLHRQKGNLSIFFSTPARLDNGLILSDLINEPTVGGTVLNNVDAISDLALGLHYLPQPKNLNGDEIKRLLVDLYTADYQRNYSNHESRPERLETEEDPAKYLDRVVEYYF